MKIIKVVRLDELLEDYEECGHKGEETFSSFIETTTDDNIYIWNKVKESSLRKVRE